MNYNEYFFTAHDGLRLFFRTWFVSEPKGLIIILHGTGEHSGRYEHVAFVLNASGYSVAAGDLRGHGQSSGQRVHINHFDEYISDVRNFLDEVARLGFDPPPVLLGHSLGGLIAAYFAEREPERICALALSSPLFAIKMKIPLYKVMIGKLVSNYFPSFFMNTGINPEWLSHDTKAVECYCADPFVSKIASARWFTEVLRVQQDVQTNAYTLQVPFLLMFAEEDRIVSSKASCSFFEKVGSKNKQYKFYRGFYHEIFNESDNAQVFTDLTTWLENSF